MTHRLRIKKIVILNKEFIHFAEEIKQAGGFDELMFAKEALEKKDGMTFITVCKDKEAYKKKFLSGIYKPFRALFTTEVPYVLWSDLYQLLKVTRPKLLQ